MQCQPDHEMNPVRLTLTLDIELCPDHDHLDVLSRLPDEVMDLVEALPCTVHASALRGTIGSLFVESDLNADGDRSSIQMVSAADEHGEAD